MSDCAAVRVSLCDARAPASGFSPLRPRLVVVAAATAPLEPDPFALGVAEGARAADEAYAAERDALRALFAAADAFVPEPSEELAAMIAVTVEHLVTELVGMMPVERDWLTARIDRAVALIGEADAARTLWLHPDDVALLGEAGPDLDIQRDTTMERGALRIDCPVGWIENSRSLHLEALRAALGIEVHA